MSYVLTPTHTLAAFCGSYREPVQFFYPVAENSSFNALLELADYMGDTVSLNGKWVA